MKTLIKNVRLLDEEQLLDVYINQHIIQSIGINLEIDQCHVIDGKGNYLFPGFIDLHVHLREPGGEAKETIKTGTLAAARGGFTTICSMPNTNPTPDSPEVLKNILEKIEKDAVVRVFPYSAITKDLKGEELVNFNSLYELGAIAFTDDGVGVQSANVMYEAMLKASQINATIVAHCEDNTLIRQGVMHEGNINSKLNLFGIPSICESVHVARDVLLAEAAQCRYHVCHVSTKESVRILRDAKRAGIRVTAEVSPHHLLLTENDILSDDANYKMNPPLRSNEDRQALIEGLIDGTIDCIATDHAPHTTFEKSQGFKYAPFGIVGLETAFPLLYTHFVKTGIFSLKQLVQWLTINPAKIFNLPYGSIEVGKRADLVIVDLDASEIIDANDFLSKGKNSPFIGWKVYGLPTITMVDGKVVYQRENQLITND